MFMGYGRRLFFAVIAGTLLQPAAATAGTDNLERRVVEVSIRANGI